MTEIDRISYGCYLSFEKQTITDQIHHFFDYGVTGMGMGGITGHSEKSVCGKVPAHENHIYIQALPIEMAKDLLDASRGEDCNINFCPTCIEIFHTFTERK